MRVFNFLKRSRKEPVSQNDLAKYLSGEASWTGIDIDRTAAMGISAVWACVRVLSETLASLPLKLYKRIPGGKEEAPDHPLYDLLHIQPNAEQTAFGYMETSMGHLALHGNHYASLEKKGSGYTTALYPLNPEKMTVERRGGELVYIYKKDGQDEVLTRDKVFHVPGLAFDGIRGYSPLDLLKQEFAIAIAAKRYGAEFFKNSGAPSGYLQSQTRMSEDALKRLKSGWGDRHSDWGKKGSVAVLEQGMEYKTVTIPPDDAQFIETMKLSTTEIARIFRVPPHLIADLEKATFSNIEHQGIEFVVHTMRPWLVRWEQAITTQLIPERERKEYFAEFNVDALLRGDMAARAQAYRTMSEIGALSANEIRALENKNPVDGGDKYYVPMNWIPTDKAGMLPDAPPDPTEDDARQYRVRAMKQEKEQRARRSAGVRFNLAKSFEELFSEVAGKIVRKETRDLKKGIDKHLRTMEDFNLYVDQYYRDLPQYIREQITPTYRAFMKAIKGEIASEIDIDGDITDDDLEFLGAFVTVFATRYINKSKADMRKVVEKGIDNGIDPDVMLDDLFDKWSENRAGEVALNESVRSSNAFARNVYLLAGVTRLIWVSGGPESCPFCASMDGSVVGIEDNFAMNNDELVAQGASLNVQSTVGHPPLHRGCVCQISAG